MNIKKESKWLAFSALLPAQAMIFMDQTILPVALPTIQGELHASHVALQWCVNAYLLLTAMFALAGGKIGDWIGHRRTFLFGMFVFTVASILCSISPNVGFLIGARALQGFGAALMIPTQTALFSFIFPPELRGRATGIAASISSLFMIIGPLIGGYLTQEMSWRWIFWINLPISLLGFCMSYFFLPVLPPGKEKMDGWGLGYFAICAASMVIFFMQGREWGLLSQATLSCAALSLLSFFLLFKREAKATHPFLDLSLFKIPVFAAINISISLITFILMIGVFRVIYLQQVLGYTPSESGLITFISCLPVLFFAPIGGYLSDRVSPKLPIAIGYILIIYSFFWLGFFSTPALGSLLTALIAFGMGIPLVFTPSYSSAMQAVPQKKLGVAFGMVTTLRTLAATMGVALIGLFIDAYRNHSLKAFKSIPNKEHLAEIASFSAIHFVLGFLLILVFGFVFVLYNRKSGHQFPTSPAEGWD